MATQIEPATQTDEDAFRAEVQQFLADNFPAELKGQSNALAGVDGPTNETPAQTKWREAVGARGWGTPTWPKEYGGGGLTVMDVLIAVEEIGAVDPGFGCVLLVNGLALMPLVWFGSEAQKKKWLTEACSDSTNSYLAGWCVSEPAGTPGGTANFDHPDPKAGIQVTADLKNGEYVINGRKYWPSNAAGWDMKGADVCNVIVRTDRNKGGKDALSCILVPRGTPGVTYEPTIDKMGQRLNQNCDIHYKDVVVPEENVFALGDGDLIISKAFTWSGPVAGIAAVNIYF